MGVELIPVGSFLLMGAPGGKPSAILIVCDLTPDELGAVVEALNREFGAEYREFSWRLSSDCTVVERLQFSREAAIFEDETAPNWIAHKRNRPMQRVKEAAEHYVLEVHAMRPRRSMWRSTMPLPHPIGRARKLLRRSPESQESETTPASPGSKAKSRTKDVPVPSVETRMVEWMRKNEHNVAAFALPIREVAKQLGCSPGSLGESAAWRAWDVHRKGKHAEKGRSTTSSHGNRMEAQRIAQEGGDDD